MKHTQTQGQETGLASLHGKTGRRKQDTKEAMNAPKLIKSRSVLQKNTFASGPRIARVDTIEMPDGVRVDVNFWYEGERLVRVDAPVPSATANP